MPIASRASFESALHANGAALVRRIFNSETMGVGSVSFQNSATAELKFEGTFEGANRRFGISGPDHGVIDQVSDHPVEWIVSSACRALMFHAALRRLTTFSASFADGFGFGDPVYLPASRTGFMQLYKAAVRRSLHGAFRAGRDERTELDLTTPAFHFIDMIAFGLRFGPEEMYASEADHLERGMSGRVEVVQTPGVNEYRYHPKGSSAPLPMKLSSALVTELTPLVLVLRHLSHFPALILEEPEAHLHPELQRRVAQVVVRLIRKGVCVWITTHSENFCQQINNFLKLGALPEDRRREAQRKLDYEPQDYLTLDDVSGIRAAARRGGFPHRRGRDEAHRGGAGHAHLQQGDRPAEQGGRLPRRSPRGGGRVMERSEPFERRLGAWIRAQRSDRSPLYEHVPAPGSVRIVEREAAGEADVECPVPEGCAWVHWRLDGLFSFLKEDKNADGALLLCHPDGRYEAHVIECKRTVDQAKWHEIARQFRWTLGKLLAIAGVLGIQLDRVTLGTAWMTDQVRLPGFAHPFPHVKIPLDASGRGTYRA